MWTYLENKYLSEYDPTQRDRVSRLTLNVDDNEYFRNRVLHRPNSDERKGFAKDPLSHSHKRIHAASLLAAERVQQIVAGSKDPVSRISQWINFLEKKAVVISLRAPDEMDAFGMFETLNDRGLKTTQADILKNYLFQQAGEKRLKEAQQKWSAMRVSLESLDESDLTLTYLRHVALATYGPVSKGGFYSAIQSHIKGPTKAIQFLDTLANLADTYAAILTPTHRKWNTYPPTIRQSLTVMRDFGVSQIRPLMLAVAEKFDAKNANLAFRAFVCWTVRFLISGGMRGQRLEDAYAERSHEIMNGEVSSASGLRAKMIQVVPNDARFRSDFSRATVSKAYLARYYLRAMEAVERNESNCPELKPVEDTNILNLEHILPENPEKEDWMHVEPEVASAYYKRIGNMVLLQATKNSVVGNAGFQKKRNLFKDSPLMLTKQVFEDTKPSTKWERADIDKRQEKLSDLAIKAWPM
ncbi:DUF262 domain-containing protein [Planctomicrobium sp. SH661]|uniref:DUF262 domain-containing protein n=1 Tax=Planctomicrobium sp. SH661 TaxID=3448124 RepID=UPI003F5BEE27